MITASISGGDRWEKLLKKLAEARLGLRVGILEGATTAGGQSIAEYAAVQEYGGTMTIPARPATLKFRKSDKTGRDVFAKASRKRGVTKVMNVIIPAHTVTVPPRAFLRTSVKKFSGRWAAVMEHDLPAAPPLPTACRTRWIPWAKSWPKTYRNSSTPRPCLRLWPPPRGRPKNPAAAPSRTMRSLTPAPCSGPYGMRWCP